MPSVRCRNCRIWMKPKTVRHRFCSDRCQKSESSYVRAIERMSRKYDASKERILGIPCGKCSKRVGTIDLNTLEVYGIHNLDSYLVCDLCLGKVLNDTQKAIPSSNRDNLNNPLLGVNTTK